MGIQKRPNQLRKGRKKVWRAFLQNKVYSTLEYEVFKHRHQAYKSLQHEAQEQCLTHHMDSNIRCAKNQKILSVAVKSQTLISGSNSLGFHIHTFRKKRVFSLSKSHQMQTKAEWVPCSIHEAKCVGMGMKVPLLNSGNKNKAFGFNVLLP